MTDKQVYFERNWMFCKLVSQEGRTFTVDLKGNLIQVPYQHVRDLHPKCLECKRLLWGSSFQTEAGTSICQRCYDKIDEKSHMLLFDGYQWMSWEGQMAIRHMTDSHLINTIGRLKKNAELAAEVAGGNPEEYLSPKFSHLVQELRRRRPEELEDIKMNKLFMVVWAIILMLLGKRISEKKKEEV